MSATSPARAWPSGPRERFAQSFNCGLEVTAKAARVGGGLVTHFADDRIGDQVRLAGPAAIEARPRPADLARDTFDGNGAVPLVFQSIEDH